MIRKNFVLQLAAGLAMIFAAGCSNRTDLETVALSPEDSLLTARIQEYVSVKLTTDLTKLTEKEKEMIPLLIEVAGIVDSLYWEQTIGEKNLFLDTITNPLARQFAVINYGPWERLNNNKPFLAGIGEKPLGANFYPHDMTKEEFEKWDNPDKTSQYTLIRRNQDGSLKADWYHDAYAPKITRAAELLKKASGLAEDPGLKKYLELRAGALLTDDDLARAMAWLEMKRNTLDFVIGSI